MFSQIINILQALLTPAIAMVTTYVAYQQYRIRRDERSLALYDRRLAIYKQTIGIMDRIRAGNVIFAEEAWAWENSIAEAQFLFGDEVQVVLRELFAALLEYGWETEPIANGGRKNYDVKCADAALKVEAFRHAVDEVFKPYLRPAGSPMRRKKRLSVPRAEALVTKVNLAHLKKGNDEDVPF